MTRQVHVHRSSSVLALPLVISLFFLWGLSYGLLDVLNKHFQEVLHIGKRESSLLQTAYFGAYFLLAFPAAVIMRRAGYKTGIIIGLLLFAIGAGMFYPATDFREALCALFVLAGGLSFLETAANPFMTVLGPPETAAFRLNLAQSFNGIGSFIGPLIGGWLFFDRTASSTGMERVRNVYLVIAVLVVLIAVLFYVTRMPDPADAAESAAGEDALPYYRQPTFRRAVVAQFFYVAAQVSVAAYFINYCTSRSIGLSNESAAYFLSIALILFTAGRFTGTLMMRFMSAGKLLYLYSIINVVLCAWLVFFPVPMSVIAIVTIFFFESIMFPTIFALGIRGLGAQTKTASSVMVMSIVGGAIVPYIMGAIAEAFDTPVSFCIPALCFCVVAYFGKHHLNTANA